MPRLRLPPLPRLSTWRDHFPRRILPLPPNPFEHREFPGRIFLANPDRADDFVRALDLKDDTVVLELCPGPGSLTRSLLRGGVRADEQEENARRRDWVEQVASGGEGSSGKGRRTSKKDVYPRWLEDFAEASSSEADPAVEISRAVDDLQPEEERRDRYPIPKLVVAVEPSPELMVRGLGMERANMPLNEDLFGSPEARERASPSPPGRTWVDVPHEDVALISPYHETPKHVSAKLLQRSFERETENIRACVPVCPSLYEDNLRLCPATPYLWGTVPRVLSNPLVAPAIPDYPGSPKGIAAKTRPWDAPPPPVSIVAQIPDSDMGEQMTSAWIASVVGASEGKPAWIWPWGRVPMNLLVGKRLYDRLSAVPGENIYSKLSVTTRACFELTPLPPFHHVPNVDKASHRTTGQPVINPIYHRTAEDRQLKKDYVQPDLPRTVTFAGDFYPWSGQKKMPPPDEPLPRPLLLGLRLTPRLTCPITLEQKDAWDYVLRRMFVSEASPLDGSIKRLGFGAEILLSKLEDTTGKYRGEAFDPKKLPRSMDIEEWARVVDVFWKWPFRPTNLLLDMKGPVEDEDNRFGII